MFKLTLSHWSEVPSAGAPRKIGAFPKDTRHVAIKGGYIYIAGKEYGYKINFPGISRVSLFSGSTVVASFEVEEFYLYKRLPRGQSLWIPLGDGDALKIET